MTFWEFSAKVAGTLMAVYFAASNISGAYQGFAYFQATDRTAYARTLTRVAIVMYLAFTALFLSLIFAAIWL